MKGHTPGPWTTGARYGDLKTEILGNNGNRAVATVWTHAYDPANDKHRSTTAHPEGESNARLIIAAPKLLRVCTDLLDACDKQMATQSQGVNGEVLSAMEQARAIIK